MPLVPHRFLFRVAFPCRYVKAMPQGDADRLLDLPESCRLDDFAAMDGRRNFADVRLAWNELGLGLQVEVRGKQNLAVGNPDRPRGSDGVTGFYPHEIDNDSGIGTQFVVADVNGDKLPDIVVANKKGVFLFEQVRAKK